MQPVPWVWRLSMRASSKRSPCRVTSRSTRVAREMPALDQHRPAPSASSISAARRMSASSPIGKPASVSASGRFGVSTVATGAALSRSAVSASRQQQACPPLATITGSTTSGTPARAAESRGDRLDHRGVVQHAGLDRIGADVASTTSICWRMKAGSTGRRRRRPGVLRGQRGDRGRGVAARAVTVLMSAWMPAPPPESEPATIRTRPHYIATAFRRGERSPR